MHEEKILLGIGGATLVVICFGIFLLSGAGSTYYYSQIDNSKIEQGNTNGDVIENGNGKDITFGTSRKLKEGAFIRLTVMPIRGVLEWSEVKYDELPIAVQEQYSLPK